MSGFRGGEESVSMEEHRVMWYSPGTHKTLEDLIERREKALGISLEGLKKSQEGQIRANRFYPKFVPKEPMIVVTEEIIKAM